MTVNKEDIDYLCAADGEIYEGPDKGDILPKPERFGDWPVHHKGHPISHGICPQHASEENPHARMNAWGNAL